MGSMPNPVQYSKKPLNMPHTRGYLPLGALVKGDSPTRTLLPIRPTGKKASPKAFVPFVLIQVGNRGFEQQELGIRFAHDLNPVVLWDGHSKAEIREIRSILSAAKPT
jgi:hypothetical protein